MEFARDLLLYLLSLFAGADDWSQHAATHGGTGLTLPGAGLSSFPDGFVLSREPWTPSQGSLPGGFSAEYLRFVSESEALEAYFVFPNGGGAHTAVIFARGQFDGEYKEPEITDWVAPILDDGTRGRKYCGIAVEYPGEAGSTGERQLGADDVEAVKNALIVLDADARANTTTVGLISSSRGGTSGGMTLTDSAFSGRVGAWCVRAGLVDLADPNLGFDPFTTFSGIVPNYPAGGIAALMAVSPMHNLASIPGTLPVKLVHGVQDRTIPITQARAFHAALLLQGNPATLVEFPHEGHRMANRRQDVILEFQDWLFQYL